MGYTVFELASRHVSCNHPGGASRITHYVDGKPYCFEALFSEGKDDQYCAQEAGFGTDHPGTGPCRYHWGNWAPKYTDSYGKHLRREHRQRYLEFAAQDEITALNLRPELNLLKTLLVSTMEAYQETNSIRALEMTFKTLDNISTTIDRIDRIQSRQTLTAAMARALMLKAISTAKQFIEPEKLHAFLDLWREEVQTIIQLPQKDILDLPATIADQVEDDE